MYFNVGDRVAMSAGATGTVVAIIERQEYARNLEAWRWQSLSRGIVVLLDDGMFAHVREPEIDVRRLGEH